MLGIYCISATTVPYVISLYMLIFIPDLETMKVKHREVEHFV